MTGESTYFNDAHNSFVFSDKIIGNYRALGSHRSHRDLRRSVSEHRRSHTHSCYIKCCTENELKCRQGQPDHTLRYQRRNHTPGRGHDGLD